MKRRPAKIERLDPASSTKETPRETVRRRRESSRMVDPRVRARRRRRRLVIALSVLLAVILGTAGAAYAFILNIQHTMVVPINPAKQGLEDILTDTNRVPGKPFYLVIIGVDTRPEEPVALSDTLLVGRIDPAEPHVQLMSIPRDTRVEIPGHGRNKINAAMQFGGPELTMATVKELTGLPVSEYVTVNFTGFKDIVNAMGGVTVYVPEDIDDIRAADYHWEARYLRKGLRKLNGMQALTFVRARKQFADQDFSRMRNQQTFLKALTKQASKTSVFALPALINAIARAVKTSLTLSEMFGLARDLRGMPEASLETTTMPGTPDFIGGVSYVIPDRDELQTLVDRMEAGQPMSGQAHTSVAAPNAQTPPKVVPGKVTVTVRNGAGASELAAKAAKKLSDQGYKIAETGNMNQFIYSDTLVVYKDAGSGAKERMQKASMVREALDIGKVIGSRSQYAFNTDVLVVVGKDWVFDDASSSSRR